MALRIPVHFRLDFLVVFFAVVTLGCHSDVADNIPETANNTSSNDTSTDVKWRGIYTLPLEIEDVPAEFGFFLGRGGKREGIYYA